MSASRTAVSPAVALPESGGPWAPLRRPTFRAVWLAAFVANVGTWMQTVGAQWLLVGRHSSNLVISLVQTASGLPVLLLVIPAGVVADFLDRPQLLIVAQGVQAAVAGLLAALTAAGRVNPELLLAFTFLLGCAAAAQLPAYQAFTSDLLPRSELAQGAALSSLGVNLARAVGPAVAGLLVAPLGVAWLFALNGISFVLFAAALLVTPRTSTAARGQARAVSWSSFEAGLHYVRHAPAVRRILLRLVLFAVPANVLWALLAPLAGQRLGLGATGYGVLLGAAGGGAVLGAVLMPRARRRWSPSQLSTLAGAVFGLGLVGLALARTPWQAVLVLVPVGVAWISVIAGLNATTQTFLPDWVRARALAVYQMVLYASFAGSAVAWGVLANRVGTGGTFLLAGGLLLATTLLGVWLPLPRTDLGDRAAVPLGVLPYVTVLGTPISDDPVEIVVRYCVDPHRLDAFLAVAGDLRSSRLRTGAADWVLLCDAVHPDQLVERYSVASWSDHRDQHERRTTPFDSDVTTRAAAFSEGGTAVQHLLVMHVPRPPRLARPTPDTRTEPHGPTDSLR